MKTIKKEKRDIELANGNILNITLSDMYNSHLRCFHDDETNDKELDKMIKDIEKIVRTSVEYKIFIRYLREEMNLSKCTFLSNIDNRNKQHRKIKIEFHHYPLTLYDITKLVLLKMKGENESLFFDSFQVASEIMRLHYAGQIGLVPLTKTLHEMAHAGKLFIGLENVFGNFQKFLIEHKDFLLPEHIAALKYMNDFYINNDINKFNSNLLSVEPLKILMEDPLPLQAIEVGNQQRITDTNRKEE